MPEELTALIYDSIVAYTKTGAEPEIAAGISGIDDDTFRKWMNLADHGIEPFKRLKVAIETAKKEAVKNGFRKS